MITLHDTHHDHQTQVKSGSMQPGMQTSFLQGTFVNKRNRTILDQRYHTAPLKISKTFTVDDELMVYMMDASPGIMDGDLYDMQWNLKPKSKVMLTNQSSTKIHPSPNKGSQLFQYFHLEDQAVLQYFPDPLVPYKQSRFTQVTQVTMEPSATLMYGDILTPGRMHRDECFDYDTISLKLNIYRDHQLEAWEHHYFNPHIHQPNSLSAFEHYTHMGVFWLIAPHIEKSLFQSIRLFTQEQTDLLIGCSRTANDGVVVRMLGHSVWRLQQVIQSLWHLSRREILGKQALHLRK